MVEIPASIILKENSWMARLAAWKMNTQSAALVMGNTIHLYNIPIEVFRSSSRLVRHELKHVEQYKRIGFIRFLLLYSWYSLRFGYYRNPLEVEARDAEMGHEEDAFARQVQSFRNVKQSM